MELTQTLLGGYFPLSFLISSALYLDVATGAYRYWVTQTNQLGMFDILNIAL